MKLEVALILLGLFMTNISPSNAASTGLRGNDKEKDNNGNGNDKRKDDASEKKTKEVPPEEVGSDEGEEPPSDAGDPDDDMKTVASMLGLTDDEAKELMTQQQDFSELVAQMEEDDDFLEAVMPATPNGEFIVKYKNGKVPSERQDGIDKFKSQHKKAMVSSVASKLSMKDAKDRGDRLIAKLEKKEYTNVIYSILGDSIEVVAKKNEEHDKKDKGKIPPGRAKEILNLEDNDPDAEEMSLYLVEPNDEDPAHPDHTYGGRKISGNGYQCTTAFSVYGYDISQYGIMTAAHCTGMNLYDAVDPEADYSTTWRGQHMGTYGDFEWHTTPNHIDLAEYYSSPNVRWPVRSIGRSISVGQFICGYSRMTKTRDCMRVYSTSTSAQYSGFPRVYNLVEMDDYVMVGGDSGGPWSYYDAAYGIHSGTRTYSSTVVHNLWSRVNYITAGLNLALVVKS